MKKYRMTPFSKPFHGKTLYRIVALKDFSDVREGDVGGWIESEDNLSQEGGCWIYNEAICCDNAKVIDNAKILNNVILYDYSVARTNAVIKDQISLWDHTIIEGYIGGKASFFEDSYIGESVILNFNIESIYYDRFLTSIINCNICSNEDYFIVYPKKDFSTICFYKTNKNRINVKYHDFHSNIDIFKKYYGDKKIFKAAIKLAKNQIQLEE